MQNQLTGVPADQGRSYKSIEVQAASIRALLGYEPSEPINTWNLFNRQLGEIELNFDGLTHKIREVVEDCASEGLCRWDSEDQIFELVLSAETYKLLGENHVRPRYTVLHEFGHIVQHGAQIKRMAGLTLVSHAALHRRRGEHPAYLDTEWQANAFSSAMLMPASAIRKLVQEDGNYQPERIAKTFEVSIESALYRKSTFEKALC